MQVKFLTDFGLKPFRGEPDKWIYLIPFSFSVDDRVFNVPAGAVTDLDSIPRIPVVYWLAKNRTREGAGVHDWLYRLQVGKEYADNAFHAAMIEEGVRKPYRGVIYTGVHLFGQSSYDKYASA